MKKVILYVAYSYKKGGAAIAAERMRRAAEISGYEVRAVSLDPMLGAKGKASVAYFTLWAFQNVIEKLILALQVNGGRVKGSINFFGSGKLQRIVRKHVGICHLHWINNCTIKTTLLKKLSGPLVITLHDEWWYLGAEHYLLDKSERRYIDGYRPLNKNVLGVDINRGVWRQKYSCLTMLPNRVIFTVPSNWMLERAKNSKMLRNKDVRLLPNCIDINVFHPRSRAEWRKKMGIGLQENVLLFGAIGGKENPTKGYEILLNSLYILRHTYPHISLVMVSFGGEKSCVETIAGFRHIELGHINDKDVLADIYSGATATIVPSTVEAFGQVALESSSCGTPVVAFDDTGLTDIVINGVTGFLATNSCPEELASSIAEVLTMEHNSFEAMRLEARKHVVNNFSLEVTADKLQSIYQDVLA